VRRAMIVGPDPCNDILMRPEHLNLSCWVFKRTGQAFSLAPVVQEAKSSPCLTLELLLLLLDQAQLYATVIKIALKRSPTSRALPSH
jgi:hypothetical protein